MWNFERFTNTTAIIDEFGRCLTYGELEEMTNKLSNAIGGRCLVFSMCDNVLGSLLGYACFLNHHIVPAMLKHDLDSELFDHLYRTYKPKYIWAPESLRENYAHCQVVYVDAGYALQIGRAHV